MHPIDQIETYLTDGLPPAERAAFEEHIAACPPCAARVEQARAADARMNTFFADAHLSADFEDRMIQGLNARQPRVTRPMIIHSLVRRAAVGVAASIVLGGIGFVATQATDQKRSAMIGTLAAILPGNEASDQVAASPRPSAYLQNIAPALSQSADDGPLTSGSLIETRNASGTITINADPAEEIGNTDRLDGNTGLASGDHAETGLALDVDADGGGGMKIGGGGGGSGGMANKSIGGVTQGPASWNSAAAGGNISGGSPPANVITGSGAVTMTGASAPTLSGANTYSGATTINAGTLQPAVGDFPHAVGDISPQGQNVTSGRAFSGSDATKHEWASGTTPFALPDAQKQAADDKTTPGVNHSQWAAPAGPSVPSIQTATGGAYANGSGTSRDANNRQAPAATAAPSPAAPVVAQATPQDPAQKPASPVPAELPPAPTVAVPHAELPAASKPKIIRTGEMDFEIVSFEVAVDTIHKIVDEETGYISTTDSDKLPSGKVKGTIVIRVAPERLDTLVLKLRGIGDLKTQNIRAQDITKQFTDMESRLRAAQAMYDQIFEIIKAGKASVKDLLEADKQLAEWREKVEQLKGEINYYSNQIALSTLTLTLTEKDIRVPVIASETETVAMTLVTEKVEDAAAKAKEAVATAKGRIVSSQIEQHDSGEYQSTITAQVPPDAADGVIERLRQLQGQVIHFDRHRSQSASEMPAPTDGRPADKVQIKREDVTIVLTLFNLAKLTARRNTTMVLAVKSVDEAKSALEEQVHAAGGRIIDAHTEYPRPDQKNGTISFDGPVEKAEGLIATLKGLGETLQINTVENPSSQGVTESKRGFSVTLIDLAAVQPRRVTSLTLVTPTVDKVQRDLIDQVRAAGGRMVETKLEHPTPDKTTGSLAVEVPADKADAFLASLKTAGETLQVATADNAVQQNVTDSKRGIMITLRSLTTFDARESETVKLASANVRTTFNDLRTLIHAQNGRVMTELLNEQDSANPTGQLDFEIARDAVATIDAQMDKDGQVVNRVEQRAMDSDNTLDSKVLVKLAIGSSEQLPPRETSEITVETADVQKAIDDLRAAALKAGGRQLDNAALSQTNAGQTTATLRLDVPIDAVQSLCDAADGNGTRKGRNTSIDTHAPDGKLARARLAVTFSTPATLTGSDDGIWAGVRRGLGTSLQVLSFSVMLIIIGLCVVVPLGSVVWAGWRGVKWARKDSTPTAPSGGAVGG